MAALGQRRRPKAMSHACHYHARWHVRHDDQTIRASISQGFCNRGYFAGAIGMLCLPLVPHPPHAFPLLEQQHHEPPARIRPTGPWIQVMGTLWHTLILTWRLPISPEELPLEPRNGSCVGRLVADRGPDDVQVFLLTKRQS